MAESGAAGGTRRWACLDDNKHGYRSIRKHDEYGAYGSIPVSISIDALTDLDDDYGHYYPVVGSSC